MRLRKGIVMIIDNVKVYTSQGSFVNGGIVFSNGIIDKVYSQNNAPDLKAENIIDGKGAYAIPGLIDMHFHGCKGYDFCDGSKEALSKIAEYEASIGVTAIAPATMTLPVKELEHILSVAAEYNREAADYRKADIVGINMEGPFISHVKKGAQDDKNILHCDVDICESFLAASEGLVKFIGIAPEENENAIDFVHKMRDKVNVSLAHTNADYDTALAVCKAGVRHAVHLYNAMPAFSHRNPGVIGAVFDSKDVMCELICDGIHIHPSVVRATFQMMGADRMILVSDSMRATGMPDGKYTLGGQDVKVEGKLATLVSDGAIAGSATNLTDCLRTVVKDMEIPLETAVACATVNPAKSLGIYDRYGSIEKGKKADIVLLNSELDLEAVFKDGERLV